MTYHFSKTVKMPFEAAVVATTEALKKHGFGVLTQIDVKDTLQKKIGVDFRPYLILGACNPKLAYEALTLEDKVGTMLPCNVVVQQREANAVEISAVDPVASMGAIDNPKLGSVAGQVRDLLQQVISDIG
ncbi:DUF302 domain-containing protein [Rhodopseudomonas sp. P2A-2r]|uniref:DUF302 domain-containing protein n=1 Tax=unclassified Rhodopseudomonas TaxID=2638247 RepID=UPI002234BD2B|nr:DUF302 domain-containing protein [Rhodopseudomonas sp. P2A-2r]UZE46920.1 DUF302 domain-containing protein [Rhodopseudomonas sp. P2A-2r]